jgi:hypothetical protein
MSRREPVHDPRKRTSSEGIDRTSVGVGVVEILRIHVLREDTGYWWIAERRLKLAGSTSPAEALIMNCLIG